MAMDRGRSVRYDFFLWMDRIVVFETSRVVGTSFFPFRMSHLWLTDLKIKDQHFTHLLNAAFPEAAARKAEGSRLHFPPAPARCPRKAAASTPTGKGNDKVWEHSER